MAAMNKISLVTVLGMAMLCCVPIVTSAQPDISGTYKCLGYDPTSNNPNFKENITFKKNGDTYKVELVENNSVIPYLIGTGIVNKNIDNAISFVFWDPTNATKRTGTEFVRINTDGSLDGVFAYINKNIAGKETCKKIVTH